MKDTKEWSRMHDLHDMALNVARNGANSESEQFITKRNKKITRINIRAIKAIFPVLDEQSQFRATATLRYLDAQL